MKGYNFFFFFSASIKFRVPDILGSIFIIFLLLSGHSKKKKKITTEKFLQCSGICTIMLKLKSRLTKQKNHNTCCVAIFGLQ